MHALSFSKTNLLHEWKVFKKVATKRTVFHKLEKSHDLLKPGSQTFPSKVWTILVNELYISILCMTFVSNHHHLGIYITINATYRYHECLCVNT